VIHTVVGLDLSLTSTGVVVLTNAGDILSAGAIQPKARGMRRLDEILKAIRGCGPWDADQGGLWVLEGYGFASSRVAASAELGGLVKHDLWAGNQQMLIVPPSTLKKFTTGKGNSQKDEMRLAVFKRWGFEHKANDVVDAYALARVGLAFRGWDDRLTKEQREALAKLEVEA
jgi:crossover junction endodeoxyribonuclease RuvC